MVLLDHLTLDKLVTATGCTRELGSKWLLYFQVVLPSFHIDTPERLSAFLSQVGVESAHLTAMAENLNYSAEGLANTWPIRYANKNILGKYTKTVTSRYEPNAMALKLARKPEAIANHCYADRMGNGNEASGDGWKFRGRGLKQLTGRYNYTKMAEETGLDLVGNPDLLLEPGYAIISACWFWDSNNLNRLADARDVTGITKIINGGTNGLVQRQALFNKAIAVC